MMSVRPTRTTLVGKVTLDSSGGGQVSVVPQGNVDFVAARTSVKTTTATKVPTANLYEGPTATPAAFLEGSYTGSNDSTDTRHVFDPGVPLTVVWAGGDAGAVATVTITALLYPPGTAPREL